MSRTGHFYISNSFQVPNAIIDELWAQMSNQAIRCYFVIVRKTVGWNKQRDKISISQLKEFTGIKDRRTIEKAIAELETLNLIYVKREQGKINVFELITEEPNEKPRAQHVGTSDAPTIHEPRASHACNHVHPVHTTRCMGCTSTKHTIQNPILQNTPPYPPEGESVGECAQRDFEHDPTEPNEDCRPQREKHPLANQPSLGTHAPPASAKPQRTKRVKRPPAYTESFLAAWKVYPSNSRGDKKKAFEHWQLLDCENKRINGATIEEIIQSRKSSDPRWREDNGRYVPHMHRFLEGERYEETWNAYAESPRKLTATEEIEQARLQRIAEEGY